MSDDFLKEVFKETSSHIRATERKYLIVTGGFIGLYSYLFGTLLKDPSSSELLINTWSSVFFHLFFLAIGTVVYSMQRWYRAWKEHYLDVCLEIRNHFIKPGDELSEDVFPFWLRKNVPGSKLSVDNLLMYLVFIVNMFVVFLISSELLELIHVQKAAILGIVVLVVVYLVLLYIVNTTIKKSGFLFA